MKLTAIADNTFREGVRQPVYLLVMVMLSGWLIIHYVLPYFTLGRDVLMFKDVSLSYILMGLLVTALLLASKVVDAEIENRTTLTLMSKPVRRWELIVGKFVGVMYAVTLMLAVLGGLLVLLTWMRVPQDIRQAMDPFDDAAVNRLAEMRWAHVHGLLPGFVLIWLQIAVMAAISVAISTRVGMVLNFVAGVAIFIVSHLVMFLAQRTDWLARTISAMLPNLESLNLNSLLIYGSGDLAPGQVWPIVGLAGGYAAAWVAVALLIGLALFRTRELG